MGRLLKLRSWLSCYLVGNAKEGMRFNVEKEIGFCIDEAVPCPLYLLPNYTGSSVDRARVFWQRDFLSIGKMHHSGAAYATMSTD